MSYICRDPRGNTRGGDVQEAGTLRKLRMQQDHIRLPGMYFRLPGMYSRLTLTSSSRLLSAPADFRLPGTSCSHWLPAPTDFRLPVNSARVLPATRYGRYFPFHLAPSFFCIPCTSDSHLGTVLPDPGYFRLQDTSVSNWHRCHCRAFSIHAHIFPFLISIFPF